MVSEEEGSVQQSPEDIFEWYLKAANEGDSEAQFFVGYMYYVGDGAEQSYVEAARWFSLAASNGNNDAKVFLGMMFRDGEGVEQSDRMAAYYYDEEDLSARTTYYSVTRKSLLRTIFDAFVWLILLPIRLILLPFTWKADKKKQVKPSRGPYKNVSRDMSKVDILRQYSEYVRLLKDEART